ncbi:MAG TPA: CHAT domain-containing protein [Agromyces sp.]|nr:CHAT domain-containing protein [Agromyces sp.]
MNTVMELEIGPGPEPGSYTVHVVRSVGGGEPSATITLDLDELVDRRPLLEASVLSSSVSARRVMSDTEAAIQRVGVRLFEATFSGDIGTAYRTSMAVASERGRGVQLALRLTAPGLAALPWEALYDPDTQTYVCRKEPLVRQVPAPYAPPTLTVRPPLRILAMISSPRGLPALDVGAERERLEGALQHHLDAGRVELHWLDDVSWAGVHGKLLENEWHVLHFIGHGGYDTETDEGVLAFVGPEGRADYVTASSLADLLDEAEPTPRLVVLNSCQSGAAGTLDLFSGTAAALAHSGIRAVAAMQFSISDSAAIAFARGFYTSLAHGRTIDEAMRSGRIGILGIGRGTLEWVTPVLYLRGDDSRLFDVDVTQAVPRASAATGPAAAAIPIIHTGPVPDAAAHRLPPTAATGARAPTAATVPTAPTSPTSPTMPSATSSTPPAPPRVVLPSTGSGNGPSGSGNGPSGSASGPTRTPHPPPRPSKAPWIVVGVIAALAVGAGITAVLVLNPGIFGAGQSTGGTTDNTGEDDGTTEQGGSTTTVDLQVPMYNEWTSTGLWCDAGETFDIVVSGQAYHDASAESLVGPDGLTGGEHPDARVYADANTASVIGGFDTTPELFAVGSGTTHTCTAGGALQLGINDTYLIGNSGEFQATVTLTE